MLAKRMCIFLILVFMFLFTVMTFADVFMWKDETGKVHITQSPPPEGAELVKILNRTTPSPTPTAYGDRVTESWRKGPVSVIPTATPRPTATEQPEEIDPLIINTWLETDNLTLTPLELTLKVWAGYAGDSLGPSIVDAITTHIRRLAPANSPLAALETLGMQVALSSQPIFNTRIAKEWVKNRITG